MSEQTTTDYQRQLLRVMTEISDNLKLNNELLIEMQKTLRNIAGNTR